MSIRLGLTIGGGGPTQLSFGQLVDLALSAERSGFDTLLVHESGEDGSVYGAGDEEAPGRRFESYTLLGALAARTERIQLGCLPDGSVRRSPAVLARQVTTLDIVSSGRAVLGVTTRGFTGTGSVVYTDGDGREPGEGGLTSLREGLEVQSMLFTKRSISFDGSVYKVEVDPNPVLPVRRGGPPILVVDSEQPLVPARELLASISGFVSVLHFPGRAQDAARRFADLSERTPRDATTLSKTVAIHLGDDRAGEIGDLVDEGLASGADGLIVDIGTEATPDRVADVGGTISELLGSAAGRRR